MKRLSRPDIDKAVRMYLNGACVSDISRSVGASQLAVSDALNRFDQDAEPADAIDCEGYRLSPDAAWRLLAIKRSRNICIAQY